MDGVSSYKKPALGFFILFCLHVASAVSADCDKSQCKGPFKFYEQVNCKPIYEKEGDCCAVRYDCSHLNGPASDKCYYGGKEYKIGDQLSKDELTTPCDLNCYCEKGANNIASFSCTYPKCKDEPLKPGCYKKQGFNCCGEQVCPKSGEDIATCTVNGVTYKDGQLFYPSKDLVCVCSKDYKGENVKPFCRNRKYNVELYHSSELRSNCAPVFYNCEKLNADCSSYFRCQNENDKVISSSGEKVVSDDLKCKFGNATLRIGDRLSRNTDPRSKCVDCVCDVPPYLTCQRSLDDTC